MASGNGQPPCTAAETALRLIGARRLDVRGRQEPLSLRPIPTLLLARIALSGPDGQPRVALATWLWPDRDERAASRNLAQALAEIGARFTAAGAPGLVRADGMVRLPPGMAVDVLEERSRLSAPPPARFAAAERLTGAFLAGVSSASAEAERWITETRLELAEAAREALLQTAATDGPFALEAARRAAALDPLDEEAQVWLCRRLLGAGRAREAAETARAAIERVEVELAVAPSPELADAAAAAAGEATRGARPGRPPRIAVTRFRAPAADTAPPGIAAGLASMVADQLARLPDLDVLSPSISLVEDDGGAGRERVRLWREVDFVIEGDVIAVADGLRLSLRAVAAATGSVVWTEAATLDDGALGRLGEELVLPLMAVLSGAGRRLLERQATAGGVPGRLAVLGVYAETRRLYDGFVVSEHVSSWRRLGAALRAEGGHAQAWLLHAYLCEALEVRGLAPDGADVMAERRAAVARAAELDPFDGRILIELGDIELSQGRVDDAEAAYRRAAGARRGGPEFEMIAAKYLAGALDDPEGARAALRRAETLLPADDPWLASNTLRARLLLGDVDAALAAAGRCPPSPLHVLFHAIAAWLAGDRKDALSHAEAFRSLSEASLTGALLGPHVRPYLRTAPARHGLLEAGRALDRALLRDDRRQGRAPSRPPG